MAKYLMLSPNPADRWELLESTDTQELKERLRKAVAGEGGGIQLITVMVARQHADLFIDTSRLTMFAVVELPEAPQTRPSISRGGTPGIMDGIMEEDL